MLLSQSLRDARILWELCFPLDDAAFLDFYFARVARAADTFLSYDRDYRPIAHIGILRYAYAPRLGGHYQLAYISGACTHPRARGQGVMAELMRRVYASEQARGTDALILIPADEQLRRYYRQHFDFTDTAPLYELEETQLDRYPALERPVTAPNAASLLTDYGATPEGIRYSKPQAEAIIDEYHLYPHTYAEELPGIGGGVSGLLLARAAPDRLYIDKIIGDEGSRQRLLSRLKQRSSQAISLGNLFASQLSDTRQLTAKPWGMALPLSQSAKAHDWSSLEISLVHN